VDTAGNMYMVGTTNESDFPVTTGTTTVPIWCDYSSDQEPCYPTADFLAKFSPQGKLLIFNPPSLLERGKWLGDRWGRERLRCWRRKLERRGVQML